MGWRSGACPIRLARDFWVRPTEGMIRAWCRTYSSHLDDQASYLPWVVEEFSGILCVDEVYQGALALLLAAPAIAGVDLVRVAHHVRDRRLAVLAQELVEDLRGAAQPVLRGMPLLELVADGLRGGQCQDIAAPARLA